MDWFIIIPLGVMLALTYKVCRADRSLCRVALAGLALIVYAVVNRLYERAPPMWEVFAVLAIMLIIAFK